jgi:hypothetical protein
MALTPEVGASARRVCGRSTGATQGSEYPGATSKGEIPHSSQLYRK